MRCTMYDYLIVGSGLFGSIFAHEAQKVGKHVLVIDKREHIGGNIYTEEVEGIHVHQYGAHIFHTSNKKVWDYIRQFAEFNRFTNCPIALYNNTIYNMPFNMNTFNKMWDVRTPEQAKAKIKEQIEQAGINEPRNLEEQAISLVGRDIYEKLIKGYSEKQWGRPATELPCSIIKRIPIRFSYDNNYFDDTYQGIPIGGYTQIIEKMLKGIEVQLSTDFFAYRNQLTAIAEKIVFTGMVDEFFNYQYGKLDYRSLRFESEIINCENYQGNAVVNYTEYEVPYTRIIEHKHFEINSHNENTIPKTVITREYPATYKKGQQPYYPLNDEKNNSLFSKYESLANKEANVIFGGRLGTYKYLDMHNVVAEALKCASDNSIVK